MEKINLLEDGKMMFGREYAKYRFESEKEFEKYAEESDILVLKHIKNSDFYKKLKKEVLSNLLYFMYECDLLARKMSCGIIFSYSEKHNCVSADLLCDEIHLFSSEIESLMKLCVFSSQMNFFISPVLDIEGAIAEFSFDLSGNCLTLTNLIGSLSTL